MNVESQIQSLGEQQQEQQNQQNSKRELDNKLFEINESLFGDKHKTEICVKFAKLGACPYASKCNFAHGRDELQSRTRHPRFRTKICEKFTKLGKCPYGNRCTFLHQMQVEVKKEKAKYQMTRRNYKTKPCALYMKGEKCPFGDRCTFIHDLNDKRNQVKNISEISMADVPVQHPSGAWNAMPIETFETDRSITERCFHFNRKVDRAYFPDTIQILKDNADYKANRKSSYLF